MEHKMTIDFFFFFNAGLLEKIFGGFGTWTPKSCIVVLTCELISCLCTKSHLLGDHRHIKTERKFRRKSGALYRMGSFAPCLAFIFHKGTL